MFRLRAMRNKSDVDILMKKEGILKKPSVNIIVPCHNEAETLAANIQSLLSFCQKNLTLIYSITIVDSASTDNTLRIAKKLTKKHANVRVIHVDQPGRGLAIRTAILQSKADIIAYMDEDLSTDISALPALIQPLVKKSNLIVIGDRYHKQSNVKRNIKRSILSVGYSLFARFYLRLGIKDYQCGFKALRTSTAKKLLENVANNQWFFDSELLVRAHDAGCDILQIPVTWTENTDSRVKIWPTIAEFIAGINRVAKSRRQLLTPERGIVLGLVLLLLSLLLPAITMNGWANTYYTMAVQAANQNWKAFFYGSIDSANFVTLDKPPLSVWLSALSARVFGLSTFSILLPHLIAGVITLLLVYIMVRRYFGIKSAIIAGFCFILTPITIVVFRYNIPDSILTVFLVASAYAFLRAIEKPQLRWLLLAGAFVGFAFNVKMIQALIVVPIYGLLYLLYASVPLLKRFRDLVLTALVFLVTALWWPVTVWLVPLKSRPFIGGTLTNNIWELIVGYNGLDRFLGTNWRQPTGATVGAGFGGKVGLLRIFNEGFGSVVAWLIPFVVLTGIMFWLYYKNSTDRFKRIAVLLWVSWVLLHAVVFGFTKGTMHPHYSVVLAPMIAALIGAAAWMYMTEIRKDPLHSPVLILMVIVMSVSATLMPLIFWKGRAWPLWPSIVVVSLALSGLALFSWARQKQNIPIVKLAFMVIIGALLFAPASSAVASSRRAQLGLIISATPLHEDIKRIRTPESSIPPALREYLLKNRGESVWIATTATAYDAAAITLSTRSPVMTIGGFSGTDNFISLNQYKEFLQNRKIRYFIVNRQQSAEIKRCTDTAANFQTHKRLLFDKNSLVCTVDEREADKISTVNITNWAQTHQQINNKEFKQWEVFDLTLPNQENSSIR